jgi:hypothetical protein
MSTKRPAPNDTTSARLYWENNLAFFEPKHLTIPVAVSVFPDEIYAAPQTWTERAYPQLIVLQQARQGRAFRGVGTAPGIFGGASKSLPFPSGKTSCLVRNDQSLIKELNMHTLTTTDDSKMPKLEKALYTAQVHTTGGREWRGVPQFGRSSRNQAFYSRHSRYRHQSGTVARCGLVGMLHLGDIDRCQKAEDHSPTGHGGRRGSRFVQRRWGLLRASAPQRQPARNRAGNCRGNRSNGASDMPLFQGDPGQHQSCDRFTLMHS